MVKVQKVEDGGCVGAHHLCHSTQFAVYNGVTYVPQNPSIVALVTIFTSAVTVIINNHNKTIVINVI